MNSRVELQSERTLEQYVSSLRTDVDGLKTAAQAFGPDALIIQRIGRTSGWDLTTTIAPYALKSFRCQFVSDTLDYPYVQFTPTVSLTNTTGFEVVTYTFDVSSNDIRTRGWIVTVSNDANTTTLNILAAFRCTDSGTITVVAL